MTTQEFNKIKRNINSEIHRDVTFKFTNLNGKESIHQGSINGVQGDCLILMDDNLFLQVIVHYTDVYLG